MMLPISDVELEKGLTAVETALSWPTSTIDRADKLLSKVEQSPANSMLIACLPLMDALIAEDVLKHSDVDVKARVASCISEITRITAPVPPYE